MRRSFAIAASIFAAHFAGCCDLPSATGTYSVTTDCSGVVTKGEIIIGDPCSEGGDTALGAAQLGLPDQVRVLSDGQFELYDAAVDCHRTVMAGQVILLCSGNGSSCAALISG